MKSKLRMSAPIGVLACALFLLSDAATAYLTARPIRFEHLGLEEGLSQNTVLAIHQDQQGFIWLGTEDGLNKYDGRSLTIYRPGAASSRGLASGYVWAIAEDSAGDLWIATDGGGVSRWNQKTQTFSSFRHDINDPASLASSNTRALQVGPDGNIWVGTRNAGLDRLDPATGTAIHFRHRADNSRSLSSDQVYVVFRDQGGDLWVGTNEGLNLLDPRTGGFIRYQFEADNPASLSGNRVRSIFEDRDGDLWIGTLEGLNRMDRAKGTFQRFVHDAQNPASLGDNRVRTVYQDEEWRLWIGTVSGLELLEPESGDFHHYRHETVDPTSLLSDEIMTVFQDRGGVLWIGTKSGGVSKWNPRTWSFGHFTHDPAQSNGLNASVVTSFALDALGRLWIGTLGGGVNVFNPVSANWTHYRHDPTDPSSLSDDRVTTLVRDHAGILWIGTMTGGLNRFDPNTKRFTTYRADAGDPTSLSSDAIMSMFEDRTGTLWVGTFGGGINRLDRRTNSFVQLLHDPNDPNSLSSSRVSAFAQDPIGRIWIGTDGGGLELLEPGTGRFRHHRHNASDPTSLSGDTVHALHVDASGTVWVGTRGGSLDRVVESRDESSAIHFDHYSAKDGLINGDVYGIQSDAVGRLWLSTNNGMTSFNPRTGEISTYYQSHGLQANEFNFGAHHRSATGEMFFGGINGFNAFFPSRLKRNLHAPPLVISRLMVNNTLFESQTPHHLLGEIDLGHRDTVATFEFAALDYAAPTKNRYAYMLEGFDADWIDNGTRNRATYTNLDAGDYTLRVRASNSDGTWNEEGSSITIHVAPAPWRTWWAYSLYGVALALLFARLWKSQQRKLRREEEYSRKLEEDVGLRTRELSDRNAELQVLNNQLLEASLTDSLTGLRNRRFLFEEVSKDIALVRRRYQELLNGISREELFDIVFLMVDLDNFKTINDSCGHAAGDRVLIEVRNILLRACRTSDIVIRWGGDEFLIIGRDTHPERAEILAERIRESVEKHVFSLGNGQVVKTTCSIGFSAFPFIHELPDLITWEQILILADAALYEAKEIRNSWVGYLSTDASASSPDLFRSIREDPVQVAEEGGLDIRRSPTKFPSLRRAAGDPA